VPHPLHEARTTQGAHTPGGTPQGDNLQQRLVTLLLLAHRISQPKAILMVSGCGLPEFDKAPAPPVCMRLLSCLHPADQHVFRAKIPVVAFYLQVRAF